MSITKKHFVHAAQHIACFTKRGTKSRAAAVAVARNLFATYNARFDGARFEAFIKQLDDTQVYRVYQELKQDG